MAGEGPFAVAELRRLAAEMLGVCGVTVEDAALVADEVVDAEERGYDSQGFVRLPSYVRWARDGSIVSPARLELLSETPATLTLDGGNGWGHVITLRAVQRTAERARQTGAAVATVRDVPHNGRLGYYVDAAARDGVIAIVAGSGDPGSATMAPWGGREPRLSTNPIAFGFPNPEGEAPIVVDLSTTQAARGKVLLAAARGDSIPETWAFDAAGTPTTDPARALPPHGTLAPLGGHKGYGLALVVELLAGGLGASYPPETGALFIAVVDPAALTPEQATTAATVEQMMTSSETRPGFDEVLLPGAGGGRRKALAEIEGVTITSSVWADVATLAAELEVELPGPL